MSYGQPQYFKSFAALLIAFVCMPCTAAEAQTALRFSQSNVNFDPSGNAFLSFLVVADVNNDGKPDLIATAAGESTLYILISNGDGTFQSARTIALGSDTLLFPVAVADVNGDGFPDIVAGAVAPGATQLAVGEIDVFAGNGDGTFQAPKVISPPNINGVGALPLALTIGDFNHDGNLDIAVEESTGINNLDNADLSNLLTTLLGTSYLEIFYNDGQGHFTAGPVSSITGGGGLVLLSGDWNQDGFADLIYNQVAAGTVTVQLGNGDGTFSSPTVYQSFAGFPENGLQLRSEDIDGDGKQDLIMTTGQNNQVLVYSGKGDGTFQKAAEYQYHDSGGLAIADFNADGFPDIAIGTVASFNGALASGSIPAIGADPIAIILGGAGGPLVGSAEVIGSGAIPLIMESGDFNGDGLPDLAAMNILSGTVSILLNQGAHPSVAVASTASGTRAVAPQSLAAVYGSNFVSLPEVASLPLPTSLRGVSVEVTDSAGVSRLAPMVYAGMNQINLQIPEGTATGTAHVSVQGALSGPASGTILVKAVEPGLYTANASGTGVPAAVGIRVDKKTSAQTVVPIFNCSAGGQCSPVPIELDSSSTVYISLYGTGIRGTGGIVNATCTAAGIGIPVTYAGSQPQFTGLDQVNLTIPQSLAGKGVVSLYLTVNGQTARPVTLDFK